MHARSSPSTRTGRRRSSRLPTSAWWGICSRSSPRSRDLSNWTKRPEAVSSGQARSADAPAGKRRGFCPREDRLRRRPFRQATPPARSLKTEAASSSLAEDVLGGRHLELPGGLDVHV